MLLIEILNWSFVVIGVAVILAAAAAPLVLSSGSDSLPMGNTFSASALGGGATEGKASPHPLDADVMRTGASLGHKFVVVSTIDGTRRIAGFAADRETADRIADGECAGIVYHCPAMFKWEVAR